MSSQERCCLAEQRSDAWAVAESNKITEQSHLGFPCYRVLIFWPVLPPLLAPLASGAYSSAGSTEIVVTALPSHVPVSQAAIIGDGVGEEVWYLIDTRLSRARHPLKARYLMEIAEAFQSAEEGGRGR